MSLIPGTGAGQRLSPTQIYQIALQAGFSAADAVTATAIALAESGGQTNIRSDIQVNGQPTYAAGLWQLYAGSSQAQTLEYQQAMADPLSNARAAYAKFVTSQKTSCGGWWPWASFDEGPCSARNEAYRNNSWRTYLGMAQAAATGTDIAGGGGSLVVPSGTDSSSALPDAGAGAGAGVVAQGGGGGGAAQELTLANLGPFALKVGSGLLWSLLFIGGALALLSVGIYLVFRQQIDQAVGQAARIGASAAAVA